MDNIEYKLGELSADMKEVKSRIEGIEKKLDDINSWRFKTVGVVAAISAALTLTTQYFIKKL